MTRDLADPVTGPSRERLAGYLGRAWRGEIRFLPIAFIFSGLSMLLLQGFLDSLVLELAGLAMIGTCFLWGGLLMWRRAANVFTSLAAILWGVAFLAAAVWMCLGMLGLPVGLPP